MEVPSCSASDPDTEYSVYLTNAYASKIELKGGLEYACTLLLEDDLVTKELPSEINENMMIIGEKIHQRIVKMINNDTFVSDEELINNNETEVENVFHEFKKKSSDEENYEPQEKKEKRSVFDPLETKIKVVTLARQHPTWSLKTLQKNGCGLLKQKNCIKRWEQSILSGGSRLEKYSFIDSWTYARFEDARNTFQLVSCI
ncbi:hypothetical protein M0802_013961 [Mischocyttarus mexicanus]|nr:hypothetical protein M0802_013961 [Mischocyttarus mexicanus]